MNTRDLLLMGLVLATTLCPQKTEAGENAGGVLLLHAEPTGPASWDEYCGRSGLSDPSEATTEVETLTPHVVWVLAAFPAANTPDMAGLTFGLEYDDALVDIMDWRTCAIFHVATPGWPAPYTGVSLIFDQSKRESMNEVAWFVAYAYDSSPSLLKVGPNPAQSGVFVDTSVPPILDPIADYGSLGFFTQGSTVFPDSGQGGCCVGNSVTYLTEEACADQPDSQFYPDWSIGDDAPCVLPVLESSWGSIKREFME